MPQSVAIDLPPAYYNTAVIIIRIINEDLELLDNNYVNPTLVKYYLAG